MDKTKVYKQLIKAHERSIVRIQETMQTTKRDDKAQFCHYEIVKAQKELKIIRKKVDNCE